MIEPNYNVLKLGEEKTLKEHIKVTCKTDVRTDDCKKVLGILVRPEITDSTADENGTGFVGKAVFSLFYLTENGLNKTERSIEFSGKTESQQGAIWVSAETEKTDYDESGEYLSLGAVIGVNVKADNTLELTAVSGGEGLVVKSEITEGQKCFGLKTGAYTIEDEFDLSYEIAEVFTQNATVCLKKSSCGVGTVILEGELYFTALLQRADKNDIIKESKTIPFKIETEYEDAMPDMVSVSGIVLKSFTTEITVDKDKAKSTVKAIANTEYANRVYAPQEIKTVIDAFSVTNEIKLEEKTYNHKTVLPMAVTETEVEGSYPISVNESAEFIAFGYETITLERKEKEGKPYLYGSLEGTAYFNDQVLIPVKISVPINKEADIDKDCDYTLCDCTAVRHGDQIEVKAKIIIRSYPKTENSIRYVEKVEEGQEKKVNLSAVSVYIPFENEDLWSISKRLSVCPDQLVATNTDLQFPLSGEERIVVYRQL